MTGPGSDHAREAARGADRPAGPAAPRRSLGFVAAAAFVLLIVILAGVVTCSGDGGTPAPPQPGSAPSGLPPAAGAGAAPESGCAPSDHAPQTPTQPPTGVSWSLVDGVAVPASRSAGPLVTRGDVARCYAHTPTGALIAAWQISTRMLVAPGWREVTMAQVAAGPGRDAYLALREQAGRSAAAQHGTTGDNAGAVGDVGASYGQLAGFRLTAYTAQVAVVDVVTRSSAGQLLAYALTVVWDPRAPGAGGDWKLHLHDDGAPSTTATPVASLNGYVVWTGV